MERAGGWSPLLELILGDRFDVNLVRPVSQSQSPNARPGSGEKRVFRNASAAVRLNRSIQNSQGHVRRDHFDHRDLGARFLISHRIHHVGSFQREQACLLDLHARDRDVGANRSLFGNRFPESYARLHPFAHRFEGALGYADATHTVMDAPRPQSPLRDLKSPPFAKQDVRGRHTNVIKCDFAVAVRRVVVAEYFQQSLDLHPSRVHRHQNHGLLLVSGRQRIRLAHEDRNFASRIARTRCPPLPAADDVLTAVAGDARLNVRRIGRRDGGFSHRET